MTQIFFGNLSEHATVFFERNTRTCVIVANAGTYLSDAVATVRALKPDSAIVIAPLPAVSMIAGLEQYESMNVFKLNL